MAGQSRAGWTHFQGPQALTPAATVQVPPRRMNNEYFVPSNSLDREVITTDSRAGWTHSQGPQALTSAAAVQVPSRRINNEYFVPGNGIDREVITTDICRYLGNDALVRPGKRAAQEGYVVTAYRNLTSHMIDDLKADSAQWEREKRETASRGPGPGPGVYSRSRTYNSRPQAALQGSQFAEIDDYQFPPHRAPVYSVPSNSQTFSYQQNAPFQSSHHHTVGGVYPTHSVHANADSRHNFENQPGLQQYHMQDVDMKPVSEHPPVLYSEAGTNYLQYPVAGGDRSRNFPRDYREKWEGEEGRKRL